MSGGIVKMGREVWEVEGDDLSPGEVILLQWNSILPKGHGTKHERATLLSSAKQLFSARYGQDNVWRETYSPRTLRAAFNDLKVLLHWMVSKSIWRFSDIGPGEILEFFSRIRSRSTMKNDHPSRATVEKWILIFRRMWEIRQKYSQSLKIDVDELTDDILALVKTREGRPWKALDDDVAISLIIGALGWIDEFGEFIAEIVQASWKEGKKELGKSKSVRKAMSKKFYSEISERDEFKRLCEKLGYVGQLHKFVSTALSVTEGACAFLLLMLVGFRVSELLALDINCLTTERAKDGSSLAYINGIAAKRGARRRTWVAGDPVPRIVQYLEVLTSFRKSITGRNNALFLGRSPGAPLFRPNVRMRRLAKTGLERRIRLFVRSGLVGGMIKAKKFHCHMARKTFAQLAVRRDKSNLEPVSAQLGHVYQAFTDKHYVGRDHHLAKMLEEADREELALALTDLLTSSELGGRAATAFKHVRQQVSRFRGRKSLKALVDRLIKENVVIAPCDWGYCVYSRAHSRCEGDAKGPNEIRRSPDVCSGCSNLSVTSKHRAWWERRARDQEVFLSRDLCTQTRLLVERRLDGANTVLAGFLTGSADIETNENEQ
ncbi:hypothetical protein R75461_05013 [Paraburkholderia nemoris]|uniref:site-specific integrase n=1 Tax=Paraburkholderia nemoris TaxID=2793076 RepID=UPI001909F6C1|nr:MULTISPECIES: site-specific integrase [Paraburkholderia]MBK3780792.1 site-specific integrase [Paraburkholderia aspalathi]CAE6797252.1 hypothetical protein R75461_05013 [Paraburkholderia nemoris]